MASRMAYNGLPIASQWLLACRVRLSPTCETHHFLLADLQLRSIRYMTSTIHSLRIPHNRLIDCFSCPSGRPAPERHVLRNAMKSSTGPTRKINGLFSVSTREICTKFEGGLIWWEEISDSPSVSLSLFASIRRRSTRTWASPDVDNLIHHRRSRLGAYHGKYMDKVVSRDVHKVLLDETLYGVPIMVASSE